MRVKAVTNKRKFYKFKEFRGVDYSSSPLEVKTNRATDMANLILRDGSLHKRNGFEQMHYLGGSEKITGAWVFKHNDGTSVLIYIQGQTVYEYNFSTNARRELYTSQSNGITEIATAHETIENKSNSEVGGYEKDKRLYILCGEYLVYYQDRSSNGWYVTNVLKSDASIDLIVYVPTTTKNITCKNTALVEKNRITYESINIITHWRKNEFVYENLEGDLVYSLDGEVLTGDTYVPYIEFFDANGKYKGGSEFYINDDNPEEWLSYNKAVINEEEKRIRIRGNELIIEDGFEDSFPSIRDEASYFILTFGAKLEKGDMPIKLGSIGAIFGNDGRADRLFIADGNLVRYSENTADYLPNFTYFPATNFVKCGQSGSITAFLRSANGTLAVFKDVDNKHEPSVYYITGKYVEVEADSNIGNVLYDDAFNVSAGNIEENCPTPNAIATLAGDSLFVSSTGVYGIQLSENLTANDRYAKSRSRAINSKLTKFDLANAKTVVYDNKYYLFVGGEQNEVYVADANYTSTTNDGSSTFDYEWFRWTDIPVSVWVENQTALWFISKDNYLCGFTDKYYDKYLTEKGDIVKDDEQVVNGRVYFDKALLQIVEKALYAEYNDEVWEITNISNDGTEESPMFAFDAPKEHGDEVVNLSFIVPIKSYWKSSITDLSSSVHKKNLYSMSIVVEPSNKSEISIGYTTRLQDRVAMNSEGANAFDFGELSFASRGEGNNLYQMFSFDAGGFVSAYRQKVFERGFVYMQVGFSCNSIGDCVVDEIAVEYSYTVKNLGVG